MIRLALEECKKLRIERVLMVCYKDNIGSRKSIISQTINRYTESYDNSKQNFCLQIY